MGSQQSTSIPTSSSSNMSNEEHRNNSTSTGAATIETVIQPIPQDKKKRIKKIPPNLKGFQLVEYKCRKKRRAYDLVCSNTKHKSFVVGQKLEDEDGDEKSCEDCFTFIRNAFSREC
jgi:hypothetical protein